MKKKGLIISTVVMVVVLIASLTTATYAWFSSQAQATIDDLTINTTAATGLQIAMTGTKNSVDSLYSGDLTYENNAWNGTEGWGTYLGFGQIEVGTIEHAVTYFKENDTLKEFDGFEKATGISLDASATYYTATEKSVEASTTDVVGCLVEDESDKLVYTNDKVAQASTTYYTIAMVSEPTVGDISTYYVMTTKNTTVTSDTAGYYQPIGYDNNMNPTGYRKVNANQKGTYYHLTMAVTNIMEVGALGFNIEVIPSGTTQLSTQTAGTSNPAMAAATRIQISVKKEATGESEKSATIAPFSDWKLQTNKTMNSTKASNGYSETKDGASNANGKYTYVLEQGTVSANSIYYVNMIIWVEGTDDECNNSTTGTSVKFNINFAYADAQKTEIAWTWENAGGGDATAITLS